MSNPPDEHPTVTANARIAVGEQKIDLKLVVPADEVPPDSLVETLQELTNIMMDGVEKRATDNGLTISCQKGCGACCRQMVPISKPEARILAQLVEDMPEPRRTEIRARFEVAVRKLAESGLGKEIINFHHVPPEDRMKLGKKYFDLGIACPFLEDESCSIHQVRPLVCREYLVASSPKHCETLDGDNIKRLRIPTSVSSTFSHMQGTHTAGDNPYLPLILTLFWVEEKGFEYELKPGPEWVQQFFEDISGKPLPDGDGDTMLS